MENIDQRLGDAEAQLATAQARCRELEEALRACNGKNRTLEEQLRSARAEVRYWREQAEALRRELDVLRAENTWLKWGVVGLLALVVIGPLVTKPASAGRVRSPRR